MSYSKYNSKINISSGHYSVSVHIRPSREKGLPFKRRSSVNSGAWLRRFDDVTGVAKTDILC